MNLIEEYKKMSKKDKEEFLKFIENDINATKNKQTNFDKLTQYLEQENIDIKKFCFLIEYQCYLKDKGIII